MAGHLHDRSGALIQHDYLPRHMLPRDVAPGERAAMVLDVPLPNQSGSYLLRLDLVDDSIVWFEERGSRPIEVDLDVLDTVPDSLVPGLLRAGIEALAEPDGGLPPGAHLRLPLRIRNCGNTRWLHSDSRERRCAALRR